MNNEINKTFEMFKDYVYSPELKELIASVQVMYNQKEKLQQRINKAIDYISDGIYSDYGERSSKASNELLNILKGVDKE